MPLLCNSATTGLNGKCVIISLMPSFILRSQNTSSYAQCGPEELHQLLNGFTRLEIFSLVFLVQPSRGNTSSMMGDSYLLTSWKPLTVLPRLLPTSGSLLGPNSTRATPPTTSSSGNPKPNKLQTTAGREALCEGVKVKGLGRLLAYAEEDEI